MNMKTAYREVERRISGVSFSRLWPGFTPKKFALYNETDCVFDGQPVEKTTDFTANTAIEYRGETVAIWDLSGAGEETDFDRLAASVIHEMFHAFQTASGESRWPNEIAALFDYEYSPENLSGKIREAALLGLALEEGGEEAFRQLLRHRKRRAERFPASYDYESRIEQIEGTAKYVEWKALTQISPEKGADFRRKMLEEIRKPENYLPIRVISYSVGAALLEAIDRYSAGDCFAFDEVPFAQKILSGVTPAEEEADPDPALLRLIAAYKEETGRIIREALRRGEVVLEGAWPLGGLNVWDARREGEYITSRYFAAYSDAGETKSLSGDFVLEMGRDCIIRRIYRQADG